MATTEPNSTETPTYTQWTTTTYTQRTTTRIPQQITTRIPQRTRTTYTEQTTTQVPQQTTTHVPPQRATTHVPQRATVRYQYTPYRGVREFVLCVLVAFVIIYACCHEKHETNHFLDCCSNKECDPRASALKAIKDNYMSENPRAQQSNVINEIETTVLIEAKKNGHRKGVGVVLYCMTGPNTCENIILNLKQSLNCSSALSGCITMMKAQQQDHADLKGEMHNQMVSVFKDCARGVIGFENLHRIHLSEAMALISAMSEQGSLMHDGKSFDSTQGLFLFSMLGSPKDVKLKPKRLLDKAREQIYQTIVGRQAKNESMVSIGSAFRRRIDHVYPVF